MKESDLKESLKNSEQALSVDAVAKLATFERDGRSLTVFITKSFRKRCRKEGVWMQPQLLSTLGNAAYAFDPADARSPGGRDGIFLLTREHRPPNNMMTRIFDQFLDKPGSDAAALGERFGKPLTELIPVRLVSHHMRLLGVMVRDGDSDRLILVDLDRS